MNEETTKKDNIIDLLIKNKLAKIENEKILLTNAGAILLSIIAIEVSKQILKTILKKE